MPLLLLLPAALLVAVGLYQRLKPMPPGLDFAGREHPATGLRLLTDCTALAQPGAPGSGQQIFDAFFAAIRAARRLIVLDVFLYNSFTGTAGCQCQLRPLAEELTDCLLAQKGRYPQLTIVVITDPINTVYGSITSPHFARLTAAGITVVATDLNRLRDSNPCYSALWHLCCRPWGAGPGRLAANPFDPGRISLRSYLRLLNFKANHRKVLIADHGDTMLGLVSSANPHGASSSHTNVGLALTGPAVLDLLASERAVLAFSGDPRCIPAVAPLPAATPDAGAATVQIVTERAIKRTALAAIDSTAAGDRIDLLIFYLTDRRLIRSLKAAQRRGAILRILLDPTKDAFGRARQGVPNRQVGNELHRAGIPVRWADTDDEQCHAKMLAISRQDGDHLLLLGSANFTRRNLDNYNLETDVAVRGKGEHGVFADAGRFFDALWHNREGRRGSLDYAAFADPSPLRRLLYRFLEATGLSTF
ncbi:MAG: phospholipase D-like domain-containing protein [Desulfobulbaceae bacterium]|nr:phospholipase D-like domain-containing protein [Desulfobulbaceae bacterium]